MDKKIAGYARVSTREQANNSNALKQQIARLEEAGAEEIYVDVCSGRWKRKDLDRLMGDAEQGLINKVIVTEVSRFGRSLIDGAKNAHKLIEWEVEFQSLRENIDISTASGLLQFNLMLTFAESESKRLSERVCDGWEYLRKRAKAVNPPFGYAIANDKYALDREPFLCLLETRSTLTRAEIAREIIDTFFERRTLRLCIRAINEKYGIFQPAYAAKGGRMGRRLLRFHPSAFRGWLLSPVLRGHTCYLKKKGSWFTKKTKKVPEEEWIIYQNTHEKILTEEEFFSIKQILIENKQRSGYRQPKEVYPLSGLVFCGECRGACYSQKGTRGKTPGYNYYYQCGRWRYRGCPQKKVVRMEVIEQAVIKALVEKADSIARLAATPTEQVDSPLTRELKSQLGGLIAIPGSNPAIEGAKAELRRQIQQLETQQHVQDKRAIATLDSLQTHFGDRSFYETLPEADKRQLLHGLVEKVIVKNGEVVEIILKV